jgi:hypothetical protein
MDLVSISRISSLPKKNSSRRFQSHMIAPHSLYTLQISYLALLQASMSVYCWPIFAQSKLLDAPNEYSPFWTRPVPTKFSPCRVFPSAWSFCTNLGPLDIVRSLLRHLKTVDDGVDIGMETNVYHVIVLAMSLTVFSSLEFRRCGRHSACSHRCGRGSCSVHGTSPPNHILLSTCHGTTTWMLACLNYF